MKAILFEKLGGPEVLEYRDVLDPQPDSSEVVVKIAYAGVNHLDIHFRRGLPGMKTELPHIPGSDASGTVHRVGSEVKHLKEGDRVLMYPNIPADDDYDALRLGEFAEHRDLVIGREKDGTYAELVKVPSKNVLPLPSDVSMEEAAAFPLVYLTAWRMVVTKAQVKPGQKVLVMGAGSGVSMAAIQIARCLGAEILTTVSTEEKAEKARSLLGVENVILYTKLELDREIRRLTGKRGVDVVIDHIGGSQWIPILRSTRNGGKIVTCGATDGFDPQTDLRQIFYRQIEVLGSTMGSPQEFLEVLQLFYQGKLHPVIDSVIPLKDARKAHEKIESRQSFGKILLKP